MDSFLERLLPSLTAELAKWNLKMLGLYELAPGVLALHDSTNEFDVFFDRERWEIVYPEVLGDSPTPGIERFLGSCFWPQPRCPQAAMQKAKEQLRPKNESCWYDEPKLISI